MANTTAWVAGRGQGLTWGTAGFTVANFNSLANNANVQATTTINNATALDLYADVSFTVVVGGSTSANSFMTLYVMPLNQDGTSYGDGTGSGAGFPSSAYQVGSVSFGTVVGTGTAIVGTFRGVVLPPGSFRFAIGNSLGVALNAAAAAVVNYRTYNENINA